MIALCSKHHTMADRGLFSKGQLRKFKSSPHSVEDVKAKFEWARPRQLVRLGGFYMGGKNVAMIVEDGVLVERFVGLRENNVGLLELSLVLRDKGMRRIAVMENNTFVAKPERMYDLEVNAGATWIRIREQKRKLLLDLRTERKTPEELTRLLESDWERAEKAIKRKVARDKIGPVFRDSLRGPFTAIGTDDSETPSIWRDESSGELVDSREHLIPFVFDWALEYCVDDEGLIPVLDFRNVHAYAFRHKLEIRNGIDTGKKSIGFGAYFSADSPHPGETLDDPRPRKPFH